MLHLIWNILYAAYGINLKLSTVSACFPQIKYFTRKTFPNVTEKVTRQTDALYPEVIFSTIGGKPY